MILRLRPIESWPGTLTEQRDYSPFTASHEQTMRLLDDELAHLGAESAVVQLALPERSFRADGSIRGDAKEPAHPGVILSFDAPGLGPLRYWTDRYQARGTSFSGPRSGWKHNLRAIALGLEALRKVERYGIAERGEQYTGWKELGAGTPLGPPAPMTADEAARILLVGADWPTTFDTIAEVLDPDGEVASAAFRLAAKRNHPDAGGNPDIFRKITEARDLLASLTKAG